LFKISGHTPEKLFETAKEKTGMALTLNFLTAIAIGKVYSIVGNERRNYSCTTSIINAIGKRVYAKRKLTLE